MRRPHPARALTLAVAALATAAVLSSCSGSSPSPDGSGSASSVGGQVACDKPTIEAAVKGDVNAAYPGATFVSLDDFSCADGWAAAKATVETSGTQVPAEFFLRAEGQFWVPTSIEDICAKPLAESGIPEPIYVAACGVQ